MDMSSPQEMHAVLVGPARQPRRRYRQAGRQRRPVDYGVSRGETGRLLRTISGLAAVARRSRARRDTHRDNEVVIRRTPDGGKRVLLRLLHRQPRQLVSDELPDG